MEQAWRTMKDSILLKYVQNLPDSRFEGTLSSKTPEGLASGKFHVPEGDRSRIKDSKKFKIDDPSTHMESPTPDVGPGSTGESCKTCAAPSTGGECQNQQCATKQKSGQTGVSNNLGKIKPHTIVSPTSASPVATANNAGVGHQEIQGRLAAHVNEMHEGQESGEQSGSVSSAPKKTRPFYERMTDYARDAMTPEGQAESANPLSSNFGAQAHDPNASGVENLGSAMSSMWSKMPTLSELRTQMGLNIKPAQGWQ